jgi:hypothetical protein
MLGRSRAGNARIGMAEILMETWTALAGLSGMHPELEWQEIAAATVAALEDGGFEAPFQVDLELIDVPGFGSERLRLLIDRSGIPATRVARVRRTYEAPRRIELAAIALAGLGLYHGGGHEIVDVAVRGSGADYLVGAGHHALEIAGRSRRSDFEVAWQQRLQRLGERATGGFYLCVVELETPSGRLLFRA